MAFHMLGAKPYLTVLNVKFCKTCLFPSCNLHAVICKRFVWKHRITHNRETLEILVEEIKCTSELQGYQRMHRHRA